MLSLLTTAKQHIDNHWIDKNFHVKNYQYINDELILNFYFEEDGKKFILHGSDTYRLAQYALLIYSLIFLHDHEIGMKLNLWDKNPEEMIEHVQIVHSDIQFKKPILQRTSIIAKVKLNKIINKLISSELLFSELNISFNDDSHIVKSTFIINMKTKKDEIVGNI